MSKEQGSAGCSSVHNTNRRRLLGYMGAAGAVAVTSVIVGGGIKMADAQAVERNGGVIRDIAEEVVTEHLAEWSTDIHNRAINVMHPPTPLVGAIGDGVADDTAAIQASLDQQGIVYLPKGVYAVDLVDGLKSLSVRSHTKVVMHPEAVIRLKPQSVERYYIVDIQNVQHVEIVGGTIEGERNSHVGSTGEWGYGIRINESSNVNVSDVSMVDCWGDGAVATGSTPSSHITFENCIFHNNRRQGLTLANTNHVRILNCVFTNTNGTAPQAGIDIEPDNHSIAENIVISNCYFENNSGNGLLLARRDNLEGNTFVRKTIVSNCTFKGNGISGVYLKNVTDITVANNVIEQNVKNGIYLGNTKECAIIGNRVLQNGNHGIHVSHSSDNIISDNSVIENASGIQVENSSANLIKSNQARRNNIHGIGISRSHHNLVDANYAKENSQGNDNAYNNISVYSNSDYNVISNNICRKGDLAFKPYAGIKIAETTSSSNMVSQNDCFDGGTLIGIENTASDTQFGAGNRVFDGTFSTTPN
ncbi:right-handed parallel beta-helix repeat-containing protein [Paenibacillus oceani]|uniref:Right-handed parallel beta-helix repeat-containing protein n=1 Tax=Paenibacillus oceani TaxID=2772510 RepID=A0A927CDZ4_9BACL|nr:right-handed parallel beta-helix repeat-containing protein [Paenibacillus oceani]MBD2865107.1 right-handed parallel beta-helix repeat-containing protein [Paenibacillus oceani]